MNVRDFPRWLRAEFEWRILGKRYEIKLSEEVERQIEELPEEAQTALREAVERIGRNPYSGHRTDLEEEEP